MSVITKGRNFLLLLGIAYAFLICAMLHPVIQRELFYLNSIKFPWTVDTRRPETCGFSPDRVESFFLPKDVHAWHIKPLHEYRTKRSSAVVPGKSKLVIYFHGTAGTLAIPHRLTTYRILSALPNVHVLAIDYRGYGVSKGVPSEEGLIEDGIAAVTWALEQGFTQESITLFGQSLGSAVAIAVAHRLALESSESGSVKVGHVVSIAGFYSGSEIVKTYRVAGYIPLLSPMRTYPWLQNWLVSQLHHKWNTFIRVRDLSSRTDIKMTFAHALSDTEILSRNSELLFMEAIRGRGNSTTVWTDQLEYEQLGIVSDPLQDGGRALQAEKATDVAFLELAWGAHNLVQWNDEILKRL